MYDELIKALRVCGDSNSSCRDCPVENCPGYGEWEFAAEALMINAADAIEKLQDEYNELLFRCGQAEALIDFYQQPPKGDTE